METNISDNGVRNVHWVKAIIQKSWRVLLGVMLFFVAMAVLFKLVLVPWRQSMSDDPDNPYSYTNKIMMTKLSNQLGLSKEQSLRVFRLFRKWQVKNAILVMHYDSLNVEFDRMRLSKRDSVGTQSLMLKIIDYELQINSNTTEFYNSAQDVLSHEQAAQFIQIVRSKNK